MIFSFKLKSFLDVRTLIKSLTLLSLWGAQIYKSPLPTAMSTRDFGRLISLANVGLFAASGAHSIASEGLEHIGWKNQPRFSSQCKKLVIHARWWAFLRDIEIEIDHTRFHEADSSEKNGGKGHLGENSYEASLLIPIISSLSKTFDTYVSIMRLVEVYAEAFKLNKNLVAQKYIIFLLTSPHSKGPKKDTSGLTKDARLDLEHVELCVRSMIPLLQPQSMRSTVLRKCVLNLESDKACGKDYERHQLCLCLYRNCLNQALEADPNFQTIDKASFVREMDAISRRINALAILSSFFEGQRRKERPHFPDFFPSLPKDFKGANNCSLPIVGVLGKQGQSKEDCFDPLKPLNNLIMQRDMATASALSPICPSLGVPNGYIHARCLIEHFRNSAESATRPSYDTDLVPVFGRLQRNEDKAELASWCAAQFVNNDKEKLMCLEFALTCAIKASNDAEQRKRRCIEKESNSNKQTSKMAALAHQEKLALQTVQRLRDAKNSLSDKLTIMTAFDNEDAKDPVMAKLISSLLQKLEEEMWANEVHHPPEQLLASMLSEASSLAANQCLDKSNPLSILRFKEFCSLVHRACQALADEYSHVHLGGIAQGFAKKWLRQGDSPSNETNKTSDRVALAPVSSKSLNISRLEELQVHEEEDETINFVMDIQGAIRAQDGELGPSRSETNNDPSTRVTSEEEPSALKMAPSSRDQSEFSCIRTALRMAFVITVDTYAMAEDKMNLHSSSDENTIPVKGRSGLLARLDKCHSKFVSFSDDICKELLSIVFAKSNISLLSKDKNMSSDTSSSYEIYDRDSSQRTITFAMRYRALRCAAVLCPQDTFERIIVDEDFLLADDRTICTLKKCTFGSFLAKEIEEMGLPLPHSALGALSAMEFSSYARALWRHHRDGCKNSKGRLLLLLIDMILKNEPDATFIGSILKEMMRLNLPRSLLAACERLANVKLHMGQAKYTSSFGDCTNEVNSALEVTAKAILSETHVIFQASPKNSNDISNALTTVQRLEIVVSAFSDSLAGQKHLNSFLHVLIGIFNLAGSDDTSQNSLVELIRSAMRHQTLEDDIESIRCEVSKLDTLQAMIQK